MEKTELQEETVINLPKNLDLYLLSRNFKEKWLNYVWQSAVAGVVTILFLYVFSEMVSLVILASVGSTFFTVFALPDNWTAKTRNVIGSYIICIIVAFSCFVIAPPAIRGGVAVGATALLMVITDTEHPPAAGVALGLATVASNIYTGALFAISGAVMAALLRHILRPWLIDLR